MPASISSVEPSDAIYVSTDPEAPIPNEITIYGSDLADATSVAFESGEDYTWVVSSMSAGSNSIIVNAYVFGSTSGDASLNTAVDMPSGTVYGPTAEVCMVLPLID